MYKTVTASIIFGLLVTTQAMATATGGPMDSTKQFIDAVLNVKEGDENSYKKIDNYINYDVITTNTIAPHKDKFNKNQESKLKNDLTQLIRTVAYPQSGTFYKESKYTIVEPTKTGSKTLVIQNTYLPKEDMDMEIGYQWENIKGKWMITDITFDEDSMVKDYQNQFGRIISKNGVDGLLSKVEEKLKEMEKK
jgi:ABC-type transporter MlaC component